MIKLVEVIMINKVAKIAANLPMITVIRGRCSFEQRFKSLSKFGLNLLTRKMKILRNRFLACFKYFLNEFWNTNKIHATDEKG